MPKRPPKCRSIRTYLSIIKSATAKSAIYRAYRQLCGLPGPKTPLRPGMDDARRELLQQAILEVQQEWESRGGGQADNPVVIQMNAVRNWLMDDLMENEPWDWLVYESDKLRPEKYRPRPQSEPPQWYKDLAKEKTP